jgi:FG-GAP repeat
MNSDSRYLLVSLLAMVISGVSFSFSSGYAEPQTSMVITGETVEDMLGICVSSAGDIDNDGYGDIIVGAWRNDAVGVDAGRVYVYSGQTGSVLYVLDGESASDFFGYSVAGAGDVNNDGYADVIVGAYYNNAGASHAGRVYVYSGQSGGLLHTFTGNVKNDWFGLSVAGAGDVDNDGYDDLIVGAGYFSLVGGRAFVYSGQTGALLFTFAGETSSDRHGQVVSGAGDIDNDGYDDVIVGAPSNDAGGIDAGRAYVYSGQTGAVIHTFTGEVAWDNFGWSVSGAGDVDNDGFPDLVVGAPSNDAGGSSAGRAYVYSGQSGAQLYTFTGEAQDDVLGQSVSSAGDVNGDGYADLIVGASGRSAFTGLSGRAYVYSGEAGGLLYAFSGEDTGDLFGFSVSGAGDMDSDGFDELIVGAYME